MIIDYQSGEIKRNVHASLELHLANSNGGIDKLYVGWHHRLTALGEPVGSRAIVAGAPEGTKRKPRPGK
jgi:hypothetical protein